METAQCFRALGFSEIPDDRKAVEAAYGARRRSVSMTEAALDATESEKLAVRLLEENYRACLRCFGNA